MKPIGIFGGTFDPIHYGHLRTAFEMLQALRFGDIHFIPCGDPPHRGTTPIVIDPDSFATRNHCQLAQRLRRRNAFNCIRARVRLPAQNQPASR